MANRGVSSDSIHRRTTVLSSVQSSVKTPNLFPSVCRISLVMLFSRSSCHFRVTLAMSCQAYFATVLATLAPALSLSSCANSILNSEMFLPSTFLQDNVAINQDSSKDRQISRSNFNTYIYITFFKI